MSTELDLMGKLALAFKVILRWETLVTLVAFIAAWLLLRYVADPSARRSPAERISLRSIMPRKRAGKADAAAIPEEPPAGDEDDEFPED